jgi:membrane-associated phospholipid phosphatase
LESELSPLSRSQSATPATRTPVATGVRIAVEPRLARVLAELSAAILRDRAFAAVALTYSLGSLIVGRFVGWPGPVAASLSYIQILVTSIAVVVGLVVYERVRIHRELAAGEGYTQAWRRLRTGRLSDRRVASYAVACLLIPFVVSCFTGWKVWLNRTLPFAWDGSLAALDRSLHGGHAPWELLQPVLSVRFAAEALVLLYTFGWFMTLQAMTVWQALAAPSHRRSRFLIASVLAWPVAGNLLAGAYLSAGPWFEARVDPASAFVALGQQISRLGGGTQWAQDYLYTAYEGRHSWEVAAGISAMPSMHVVMATIIASFLWGYGIVGRVLGAVFVVGILVGSVVLGWHYAVDGYAGIVAGLLIWFVAGQVARATGPD